MAWYDPRTWLAQRADVSRPPSALPVRADPRNSTQDPARYGDLEAAARILQRCFQGETYSFIDLCKSARRYDGRLDAVAAKRVLAIQGRRWALKPPPGFESDREAIANCDFVTRKLNATKGFATKLGHLGHAVLEGHAALQHVWHRDLDGDIATAPREIHPRLFGWNVATSTVGVYLDGVPGKLTDLAPNEWVFHNPTAGRADDPWLRGAMRSRILPSITKRMGIRWWLKLLERWGQPQVVAEKGADEDDALDDDIIAALRALGTDWRAVVPPGTKITSIPADVKSDLHEKWVQKIDSDDAIAILGQNLSTEVVGGSFAAARAHAWVLATILEADLAELSETITDQWIEPLIRFNRPGSPVPWLFINPAPLAEITKDDMSLRDAKGRPAFSVAEYRASKGFDPRPVDVEPEYEIEVVVDDAPAGAIDATPKVDEVAKALELARGVGLQATPESVAALLASLGVQTSAIPDGAPQPKPIPLAPTDLAKVVQVSEARGSVGLAPFGDTRDALTINELDAQIAAEAERAKLEAAAAAEAAANPPPEATANAAETPPAPAATAIEAGAIWTDTRDGHRIKVNAVEDGQVYAEDLDAPNAAGLTPQFTWSTATFREWCKPPASE